MNNVITIKQLRTHLEPLVPFGELLLEVQEGTDGYKIVVIEHEKGQLVNLQNEVVDENYSSKATVTTLHTDQNGTIKFIEHPFGAFTKANKNLVPILVNLIGHAIDTNELRSELAC
ncbi:hypothetical protein QTG56_23490 (plasmid) [Rossellomorea sp. AcN35-11]|nr:hypothetical protein [Rossellomorea aquimaris]WJV32328.1 hypothetical protein QTG56_23490 [Rossellomorea sp. AcN35-11]